MSIPSRSAWSKTGSSGRLLFISQCILVCTNDAELSDQRPKGIVLPLVSLEFSKHKYNAIHLGYM